MFIMYEVKYGFLNCDTGDYFFCDQCDSGTSDYSVSA